MEQQRRRGVLARAICCALLVAVVSGCAWKKGRADRKTVRQTIYELWKTKPEWETCLEFHKYVAENKKFLDMMKLRVCYVEKGKGEDVILLHGLFSSKNTWRANFLKLAEHYHVVALDVPGSGDSDNPHHTVYPYTPENLAKTVLVVMNQLKIEQAHLIGNSLGGLMALIIARDHPERVRSLVTIAPAVWDYYGKIVKAGGLAYGFGPALATARPTAEFGNSLIDDTVHDPTVLTEADRYHEVKSLMQNGARNALIEKSRALFNGNYIWTISESFRGLEDHTLIIWGQEDKVLPPFSAHRLYGVLPHSEVLWIPACGHHPQEETPRIVNEEILYFLSQGKLGRRGAYR